MAERIELRQARLVPNHQIEYLYLQGDEMETILLMAVYGES
jgi:hypothetical protein